MKVYSNPSEFRIVLQRGEDRRLLCKLWFYKTDTSLYLVPYAANRRYFFGQGHFDLHQKVDRLNYTEQLTLESGQIPHLSIHQSGRVHIREQHSRLLAGPLMVPAMPAWRGEHAATVQPDSFDGLAPLEGALRTGKSAPDIALSVAPNVGNIRVGVYLNGEKAAFPVPKGLIMVALRRAPLASPVFVGITIKGVELMGPDISKPGVTVLAGWDPRVRQGDPQPYLYVRGE